MGLVFLLVIIGSYIFIIRFSRKNKNNSNRFNNPRVINSKSTLEKTDLNLLKLSTEQKQLFNRIEHTKSHLFVTGKAGTGKSVLLQYFKNNSKKKVIVCAPTGVSALNVGGQTIHSLFKIPPTFVESNSLSVYGKTALLLKNIDTLVIDEVSMVRADLMDAIDHIMKLARGNNEPFGGAQVVMFGDLYQLPPVVNSSELHKYFSHYHDGYFFFNANIWKHALLNIFELNHIFRQKDENFKNILNSIRVGNISNELLETLNKRVENYPIDNNVITLTTTNKIAADINQVKLDSLEGKLFQYKAKISGDLSQSAFPTDDILSFKKGAQVIMLKNDKDKRWVNGSLGIIDSLSKDHIKVKINGFKYTVPLETWNKITYLYNIETEKIEEDIVSSFAQYPLRLAWAITIHKSQGQTYDAVAIDLGNGSFAHGQTYVALSRCKSLDKLYLKRKVKAEDIIVDQDIINFMSKTTKLS